MYVGVLCPFPPHLLLFLYPFTLPLSTFQCECLGISLDGWKMLEKSAQNEMLAKFLTAKTETGILPKAIHDVQFDPKNTHFREINLQGPDNPVRVGDITN